MNISEIKWLIDENIHNAIEISCQLLGVNIHRNFGVSAH